MKIEAFNREILANPLINPPKNGLHYGLLLGIRQGHRIFRWRYTEWYGHHIWVLQTLDHVTILWFWTDICTSSGLEKKAFEYVRYMLCLFLYTRPEDFEPAVLECVNHWPAEKDTATMANCSYVIALTDPGIKSSLPSHVQTSETTLWFLHGARSPISPDARAATLFWSGGDVVSVSSCLALIIMGYKSMQLLLPAGRKKALVSAALQLLIRRPTSANCWRSWSAHGVLYLLCLKYQLSKCQILR